MQMSSLKKLLPQMGSDELKELLVKVFGEEASSWTVWVEAMTYYGAEAKLNIQGENNRFHSRTDVIFQGEDDTDAKIRLNPDPSNFKFNFLSPEEQKHYNLWVQSQKIREARTTKDTVKAVFEFLRDKWRKPVSPGCVKAYVGLTKLFWVSKKKTSNKIAKIGAHEWYLAPGSQLFQHVYDALDDDTGRYLYRHSTDFTTNYLLTGNKWYKKSLLVKVYNTYNPLTDMLGRPVLFELPSDTLIERYKHYVRPDGSIVFTTEPLPYAKYWGKPIHSYSERIENVLEKDDLFRKGTVDLYARRKHEEVPYLGWELEACYNRKSTLSEDQIPTDLKKRLDKIVFCKADGSIRPSGFETVSIPATLDFWKESGLASALDTMRASPYSLRSYEHSSCGFHVHVSRTALSVLDLQKLERFMHNPDNTSFLNAVAGRGPNTYQNYYPNTFFHKRKNTNNLPGQGQYRQNDYVPSNLPYIFVEYFGFSGDQPPLAKLSACLYYYVSRDIFYRGRAPHLDPIAKKFYQVLKDAMVVDMSGDSHAAVEIQAQLARRLSSLTTVQEATEDQVLDFLFALGKGESSEIDSRFFGYTYYFRAYLEKFYPGRFDFSEKPKGQDWRATVLKTKLPIGRLNNYSACQGLKSSPLGKGAAGRYDVLNTNNKNTVEFRLFKGTMNPQSVFRYLEFVDALVRFVPSTSASNEGLHFKTFISWLVKDSFNVMRYNNLVAFLVAKEYVSREQIRKRELSTPQEQEVEPDPVDASIPVAVASTGSTRDIRYCDCLSCRRARDEIV